MQVEEKVLEPLRDGTIALPQPQESEVARMRNLVLKRRSNADDLNLANVKMIENNDADVRVRDVVPYIGSQSILPYNSIKHPIQRRMEKEINSAKKQARIVRAKKIDLTTMEFEDMPRIKRE